MDILKIKPFVEVSVGQLLWGYEDPLLKLAKDVVPKEQKLPYEEFGLMYGKNSTSEVWFQYLKLHKHFQSTICFNVLPLHRIELLYFLGLRILRSLESLIGIMVNRICHIGRATSATVWTDQTVPYFLHTSQRTQPYMYTKRICVECYLLSSKRKLRHAKECPVIDSRQAWTYLLQLIVIQRTCASAQLVRLVLRMVFLMYRSANTVRICCKYQGIISA